jgi:hypothetical protein
MIPSKDRYSTRIDSKKCKVDKNPTVNSKE